MIRRGGESLRLRLLFQIDVLGTSRERHPPGVAMGSLQNVFGMLPQNGKL